ncbi:MAG: ribosome maturation factor RimP [Magnetococcales bacterium]|nr:ribosome maturation factor RimP [Magnetococcales bacterium]
MSRVSDEQWQRVEEVAQGAAEAVGCELVDVSLKQDNYGWVLRVLVEKVALAGDGNPEGTPPGVSLEECSAVSERMTGILDVEDPISQPYRLEVSSPGVERPLKKRQDFVRFAGSRVHVELLEPLDEGGRRRFTGQLQGLEGDEVVLVGDDEGKVSLPLAGIAKARLQVNVDALFGRKAPSRNGRRRSR